MFFYNGQYIQLVLQDWNQVWHLSKQFVKVTRRQGIRTCCNHLQNICLWLLSCKTSVKEKSHIWCYCCGCHMLCSDITLSTCCCCCFSDLIMKLNKRKEEGNDEVTQTDDSAEVENDEPSETEENTWPKFFPHFDNLKKIWSHVLCSKLLLTMYKAPFIFWCQGLQCLIKMFCSDAAFACSLSFITCMLSFFN